MITTFQNKKSVFLFFFTITVFCGVVVQFLLPQFIPSAFQNGLILKLGDSVGFHQKALIILKDLQALGISSFQWKGDTQIPAVILGFLYFFSGLVLPSFYIPFNALMTGLTSVTLVDFFKNYNLKSWETIAFIALVSLTPTSLGWLTQISKDIFVIFAIVAVFKGLFEFYLNNNSRGVIWYFCGALVMLIAKNHYVEVILLGTVLFYLTCLTNAKFRTKKSFVFVSIAVLLLYGGMKIGRVYYAQIAPQQVVSYKNLKVESNNKDVAYNYEKSIPVLDSFLIRLSYAHFNFTNIYKHGNEQYFPDWKLSNGYEVLKYMPVSLVLGFFDPLPWKGRWDKGMGKGALFLLLQIEMFFFYAAIFFIIKFYKRQTSEFKTFILAWTIFASVFIVIFGFTSPNLGAINRYRFPFLMCFKILALMSWLNVKRLTIQQNNVA
jgi:hypothetical protein